MMLPMVQVWLLFSRHGEICLEKCSAFCSIRAAIWNVEQDFHIRRTALKGIEKPRNSLPHRLARDIWNNWVKDDRLEEIADRCTKGMHNKSSLLSLTKMILLKSTACENNT